MTSDLVEQHKAFKQNASQALHEFGDRHDLCSEFDRTLRGVGLAQRPKRFRGERCDDPDCETCRPRPSELVGEATAEEHETWKRATAIELYLEAKRHGLVNGVESAMQAAGFPAQDELLRTVRAQVKGTFTVDLGEVTMPIGDNLVDHISVLDLINKVGDALRYGDTANATVTWKTTLQD